MIEAPQLCFLKNFLDWSRSACDGALEKGLLVAQVLPVKMYFGVHNNNVDVPYNMTKLSILTHLQGFYSE
jgi:hypothetical protein